jgi:hypothetical protein
MPADWTVPFKLTSKVFTNNPTPGGYTEPDPLPLNTALTFASGPGIYLLRQDGCSLTNQVRATKENAPQEDGAILHCRFVAGMEMALSVQMWQDTSQIACDTLLQEMVDTLDGYLYGLLNAGDNEGRIAWAPVGGASGAPGSNGYRMLDDIRLLSYPDERQPAGAPLEVTFTIDCELPYAEDETQLEPALAEGSNTVTNYGNRPTYPVWKLDGAFIARTLTNSTTGDSFSFNCLLPGALPGGALSVAANEYIEIDTFRNTVTLVKPGPLLYNVAAGIEMESSTFGSLLPGDNTIVLVGPGATGTGLVNAAWVS